MNPAGFCRDRKIGINLSKIKNLKLGCLLVMSLFSHKRGKVILIRRSHAEDGKKKLHTKLVI